MIHLKNIDTIKHRKDLDASSLNLEIDEISKSGLTVLSFREVSDIISSEDYDDYLLKTLDTYGFKIIDHAVFFSQSKSSDNHSGTSLSFIKLYKHLKSHILNIDAFLGNIYYAEKDVLDIFNNKHIKENQRLEELLKVVPERTSRYLISKNPIGKTAINKNKKGLYYLRSRDGVFCSILEKFIPIPSMGGSNAIANLLLGIYKCIGSQRKVDFTDWLLKVKKTDKSCINKSYPNAMKNLSSSLMVSEYYLYEYYSSNSNDCFEAIDSVILREDFVSYYKENGFPPSYLKDNFCSSANKYLRNFFNSEYDRLERNSNTAEVTPLQQIFHGPPGTGKSFTLKQMLKSILRCESEELDTTLQVERIVGHPELNSADFIGSYRPITIDGNLEYTFIPGPFTRLLKRSLDSETENTPHILIIEELNRTNAAALFAEVFQLLDRDDDGRSEYATNLGQDVNRYLGKAEDFKTYLPANFAIWATMNTADQGVFPLDTAFKRRWSFEYLGVDEGQDEWWPESSEWNPEVPRCSGLRWQQLRIFINRQLTANDIDEDRQLGGFFLSKRELKVERVEDSIMTKVIGYLRDDVLRYEPHALFKSEDNKVNGFGSLLKEMKKSGILSVFKGLPKADTVRESIEEYVKAWKSVESNDFLEEDDQQNEEEVSTDTSSEEVIQSTGDDQ